MKFVTTTIDCNPHVLHEVTRLVNLDGGIIRVNTTKQKSLKDLIRAGNFKNPLLHKTAEELEKDTEIVKKRVEELKLQIKANQEK